jgi:hypothetical protein
MSGLGPEPRVSPLRWVRRASVVIGVVLLVVGAILWSADNDSWWIVAAIGVFFLLDIVILTPIIRRDEQRDSGLP